MRYGDDLAAWLLRSLLCSIILYHAVTYHQYHIILYHIISFISLSYHQYHIISLVSDLTALVRACLAKAETALRGLVTRHLEGVKEAAERLSSSWHARWRAALSWDGCAGGSTGGGAAPTALPSSAAAGAGTGAATLPPAAAASSGRGARASAGAGVPVRVAAGAGAPGEAERGRTDEDVISIISVSCQYHIISSVSYQYHCVSPETSPILELPVHTAKNRST